MGAEIEEKSIAVRGDNESDTSSGPKVGEVENKKIFGVFEVPTQQHTERKLSSRQAQLIALGGCIGTALFVTIGTPLSSGGPLPLFGSYLLWCTVVYGTNCGLSEMTVYLPIDSTWIRYVTRYVDEAIGVANGWNFFLGECTLVCFEVTAMSAVLQFWTDKIPTWVPIVVMLVSYALLEALSVDIYGEVEFWLAIGKVLLVIMLIFYAFFTMVGANPLHWVYGFHYWNDPGMAVDYRQDGGSSLSYFEGFVVCVTNACYVIAGPDYVSITAGEVKNPRETMPRVFNAVVFRLFVFFALGSLAVGIVCPSNSDMLLQAMANDAPGAAVSPYVISMTILKIKGLPHLVNAMVVTSIYSAGNNFYYCATRTLFGMAQEGKAPKFFKLCLPNGAPAAAMLAVAAVGCLSFLQLNNNAQVVLNWFISLAASSLLIYMFFINVSYFRWRQGLKAQGIDYNSLKYKHRFSGWITWYSLSMNFILIFVQGYSVFKPGSWNVPSFLFSYFMVFFVLGIAIFWKCVQYKRGEPLWVRPETMDLTTGKAEIDQYEENYVPPPKTRFDKFLGIFF
ncbi:hypothetical protein TRICI_004787 [Trichomonascus ciferrii]|uniref:Amino acid permease/ SLC12A domain-containing protein n=1 Tax=Trichomonascus ciferrii TaxID=44093 RepID=A0A642UZ96_9ASCO|nr:hypothetical protein TRICI_004787 [Trichomonascus ciferrii]